MGENFKQSQTIVNIIRTDYPTHCSNVPSCDKINVGSCTINVRAPFTPLKHTGLW